MSKATPPMLDVAVAQHRYRIIPGMWLNRSSIGWACAKKRPAPRSRYVSAWFDAELTKLEGAE
jgi:hypothetical protein